MQILKSTVEQPGQFHGVLTDAIEGVGPAQCSNVWHRALRLPPLPFSKICAIRAIGSHRSPGREIFSRSENLVRRHDGTRAAMKTCEHIRESSTSATSTSTTGAAAPAAAAPAEKHMSSKACNKQADEKKLTGEDRAKFVKDCHSGKAAK